MERPDPSASNNAALCASSVRRTSAMATIKFPGVSAEAKMAETMREKSSIPTTAGSPGGQQAPSKALLPLYSQGDYLCICSEFYRFHPFGCGRGRLSGRFLTDVLK